MDENGHRKRTWIGMGWGLVALLLLGHGLSFGDWIVDDAGISFAYARNAAAGHGLVAQPGVPPVEGFSNFAWVMILVPFFALDAFDPVVVPKVLAFLLLGATFWTVRSIFRRISPPGEAGAVLVCGLLALNTSFVAWGVSGLENPLYAFGTALTLMFTVEALASSVRSRATAGEGGDALQLRARAAILCGLAAAGVAMTRPDGVLFAAGLPLATFWMTLHQPAWRWPGLRVIGWHSLSFTSVFGAFLLFRRLYFGRWLPNTYTAKMDSAEGGPLGWLVDAGPRESPLALLEATGGKAGVPLAVLLLAGWLLASYRRRIRGVHRVWLVYAGLAALIFFILPPDWMAEFRFATPFFIFFYGSLVMTGDAALRGLPSGESTGSRSWIIPSLCTGLILGLALDFGPRSRHFAKHPTVPFQLVAEKFAHRFDRYADRLGLEEASVLLPDVGAALYYSRLRVHDLAGLLDPVVARTLGRNFDALHDHVFGKLQPTFIHSHGHWAAVSQLERDPRFHRDYLPLPEVLELGRSRAVLSGDYIRREVAEADPEVVAEIQRELHASLEALRIAPPKSPLTDSAATTHTIEARAP